MHKLISTEQAMMDRYVTLRNMKTGTIDYCFDRSDFPEDKYPGFYFMEIGGQYECKIVLFGSLVSEEGKHTVRCRVLDPDVMIGNCRFVKVGVGEDVYYVYHFRVKDELTNGRFLFRCPRKDLIQVDDVVLSDFYLFEGLWE